jgi:hypothetical protein
MSEIEKETELRTVIEGYCEDDGATVEDHITHVMMRAGWGTQDCDSIPTFIDKFVEEGWLVRYTHNTVNMIALKSRSMQRALLSFVRSGPNKLLWLPNLDNIMTAAGLSPFEMCRADMDTALATMLASNQLERTDHFVYEPRAGRRRTGLNKEEPAPKPSEHPAVWGLVIKDMQDRDHFGAQKYGQRLKPHDGRNALVDAYQEVLDLAVYLRKKIYEESGS